MTGEQVHLLKYVNLILHSACLQAGCLLPELLMIVNQKKKTCLPSLLWQVTLSSMPCLSDCSVMQTQADTVETDQDVSGSGRLNEGLLRTPGLSVTVSQKDFIL